MPTILRVKFNSLKYNEVCFNYDILDKTQQDIIRDLFNSLNNNDSMILQPIILSFIDKENIEEKTVFITTLPSKDSRPLKINSVKKEESSPEVHIKEFDSKVQIPIKERIINFMYAIFN